MKAMVMTAIRELAVVDVPEPRITEPGQAIIQVAAAGICGSDLHGYTGQTGRRKPPLVMGHEAAGTVIEVAPGVTNVAVGQRVAIHPLRTVAGRRSLIGMDEPGAYAERVGWPASNLWPLPDSLSFTAAAMTEPVAVTVRAVRKLPEVGSSLLVVGAGTIGLLAAQVARAYGWEHVIVSDLDATRLEVAERLGFTTIDAAITGAGDPVATGAGGAEATGVGTGTDALAWIAAIRANAGDYGVDAAIEAVGVTPSVAQAHAAVRYGGNVVWIGNNAKFIQVDMQDVVTRELTVHGTYGMSDDDFAAALELLNQGALQLDPLLSRFAPLADGPALFEELLSTPALIKGMFVFDE